MMNTFLKGAQFFVDGFGLITKPGMKRFVIIPLIINLFFFIGFFFLLNAWIGDFNAWFTQYLPHWLSWLSSLLWLLFLITFILLFLYTFVMVANLIAAPFNSFLAEKVEFYLSGKTLDERSLLENIKDLPRILGRQLSIVGYYLPRAFLILILFFVPIVQTIAPIIWFLFNAWFLTLTFMDYPSDNHRVPLKEVKIWLKGRRIEALGFGSAVIFAALVPFLNCFAIPAAVAGATKYWMYEKK